jgi:hypothetical protein
VLGLLARGGYLGSRSGRRNGLLYVHGSLYSAFLSISPEFFCSSVHLIDNFVWQYNVEPTRATSEALDAS